MTDERRDLAASEALGALPPEESEELRAELEQNPTLSSELDEYRSTVSMLESAVARETPSHDLFAAVLAEIDASPQLETPQRAERTWRRALPAFVAGAAASVAVFAIVLALGSKDDLGSPDAVAAVQGTSSFQGVHGEARIYRSGTAGGGVLRLDLAEVPPPPEGQHYEVWVLRPSTGEAMEAIGVFNPTTSEVSLELGLPGAGDYEAVDISVEPDAGSPEHSGTSLAGGRFERETTDAAAATIGRPSGL